MKIDNDGGMKSRKLWVVLFAMSLVTSMAYLTCKCVGLSPIYSTLCSTIVGLTALYIGGNSAIKLISAKHTPKEIKVENSSDKK